MGGRVMLLKKQRTRHPPCILTYRRTLVVAALSVSAPASRCSMERMEEELYQTGFNRWRILCGLQSVCAVRRQFTAAAEYSNTSLRFGIRPCGRAGGTGPLGSTGLSLLTAPRCAIPRATGGF